MKKVRKNITAAMSTEDFTDVITDEVKEFIRNLNVKYGDEISLPNSSLSDDEVYHFIDYIVKNKRERDRIFNR